MTMQVVKKPASSAATAGIGMAASCSAVAINGESSSSSPTAAANLDNPYAIVSHLASTNAVVVFTMSGCCMCTVAKHLLLGLGVGPTIIELDRLSAGSNIRAVLYQLAPEGQQEVPAVFVGGKFLGGIETLMACHINGTLVPLLKDAGALWL